MSSKNPFRVSSAICNRLASLINHSSWSQYLRYNPTRKISRSQTSPMRNILYSAVCVERVPVVATGKSQLEEDFANLSSRVELENSYYSDHEIRLKREEKSQHKQTETPEEGQTETALDLEDKWDAEVKQFEAASRTTAADTSNDQQSLDRRLDSSLYLLVKQKIEGRDHWVLPQATWEDGETIRETAERALRDVCGDVQATFLGNAPCAVAKYEPLDPQEERGIKLFFYKAWFREGKVTPNTEFASDYRWVTKDELSQFCHNGYRKSLGKFLS